MSPLAALAAALVLALPRHALTPGATFPTATRASVCRPGYTDAMRNVPASQKARVCAAYGIKVGCPGPAWEVDHLISLELGGSNDDRNLWPQPIEEARRKDVTETALHRAVCRPKHALPLATAQRMILDSTTWGEP